ncbi:MAG: hypothetical protein JW779_11275 [Candidatus Thorarchaeota archaeon]|nr:hypothetical protein [Candidatus Thorarchaeota archaeon]
MIGFIIAFTFLMLCAACSFGKSRPSGRVVLTRPSEKEVEGLGGARGYDYSYSGQSLGGVTKPFPVGLGVERAKSDTHKSYKRNDEDL